MQNIRPRIKIIPRRSLILSGPLSIVLHNFLKVKVCAKSIEDRKRDQLLKLSDDTYTSQFVRELDKILEGSQPLINNNFTLELPEYAENGSIVPFKMLANHPMERTNYVQTLHLLSTLNPSAWVASFVLSPENGKAEISGRMRVAKTQDVYAIAHLSIGQFIISMQKIEVLIGGCGME